MVGELIFGITGKEGACKDSFYELLGLRTIRVRVRVSNR